MKHPVLLLGTGLMGIEYARVLKALDVPFVAVGRGTASGRTFEESTGIQPITGGLNQYIMHNPVPERAIVATDTDYLTDHSIALMNAGCKTLLVEKPGGLNTMQNNLLLKASREKGCQVSLAYNRRFYASVIRAQDIIQRDGGLTSIAFDFTEWIHEIETLDITDEVRRNWLLRNSSHVIDLAFFFAGFPSDWNSYSSGSIEWHPKAIFSGAGVTVNDVLFCYHANWESAGRWSLELHTRFQKLILRPLEKLQSQQKQTTGIEFVDIDDSLDSQFKPGIYNQTRAWLEDKLEKLSSIENHLILCKICDRILGV